MATEHGGESEYKLSCEILGHTGDVRAVECVPLAASSKGHVVLTASRDGTACVWEPLAVSSREYVLKKIIRKHTGYVSALCIIPADETVGRLQAMFATGGQDTTVMVHSLEASIEEPLERYIGHQALVSRIIYQHDQIISASWDSTVRIWKNSSECDVLDAHNPAVWALAGLHDIDGSKRILTGGADKLIKLWDIDKSLCVLEYRGHTNVVRDVKIASKDVFFSAANDCVIRKWNIHTGQCLNELYGHEAFIYSLSLFSGRGEEDEFISGGEDRTVRVWKGGVCVQVIHVPAVSVWTVCCMESGDIISGSSDAVARVFTRSSDRVATAEELRVYNAKVTESSLSSNEEIDVKKLPGPEALSKPGGAEGENMMINNNGSAEVYQWSAEEQQWVLIGNAIGKAPEESTTYNGQEYDFVFTVELDEETPARKLKLPYNKSMDPYLAAEDFLTKNNLPASYLDQVAEFIIKNAGDYHGAIEPTQGDPFTGGARYIPGSSGRGGGASPGTSDPFTGGSRYRPGTDGGHETNLERVGGSDPFTGGSSYRPSDFANNQPEFNVSFKAPSNSFFPMSGFKLFTSPQDYCDKIIAKISEFNSSITEDLKFSETQLQKLKDLCATLSENSYVESYGLSLVETILRWPAQYTFPGIDLVRLVLTSRQGSEYFLKTGQTFLESLIGFGIDNTQPKNQVPVLRALANIFTHDTGTQVLHCHRKWVLDKLHDLFDTTNRTSQIALSTIILNYCHYYGTNTDDASGIRDCALFSVEILNSSYDFEAKFRILIGLGTMAITRKSFLVSSLSLNDLLGVIRPLTVIEDPVKVSQCSKCVLQVLKQ